MSLLLSILTVLPPAYTIGPPSFGDAAFRLTPAGGRIRFNLRYYD